VRVRDGVFVVAVGASLMMIAGATPAAAATVSRLGAGYFKPVAVTSATTKFVLPPFSCEQNVGDESVGFGIFVAPHEDSSTQSEAVAVEGCSFGTKYIYGQVDAHGETTQTAAPRNHQRRRHHRDVVCERDGEAT